MDKFTEKMWGWDDETQLKELEECIKIDENKLAIGKIETLQSRSEITFDEIVDKKFKEQQKQDYKVDILRTLGLDFIRASVILEYKLKITELETLIDNTIDRLNYLKEKNRAEAEDE